MFPTYFYGVLNRFHSQITPDEDNGLNMESWLVSVFFLRRLHSLLKVEERYNIHDDTETQAWVVDLLNLCLIVI